MDPNQNSALLEALARRAGPNGSPAGGSPLPAIAQQMGAPANATPSASAIPNVAPRNGGSQPQQVPDNASAAAQAATGPQFDSETRDLAKQLIARLVKGI